MTKEELMIFPEYAKAVQDYEERKRKLKEEKDKKNFSDGLITEIWSHQTKKVL